MNYALIFSALMMGLAGTVHCVAMCGASSAAAVSACGAGRSVWTGFHLGRVLGYAAAGALAASSVSALAELGRLSPALRPLWGLAHMAALVLGIADVMGKYYVPQLGAFVVYYHLPPELVIFHFILSMILIDAAFALYWCSRYEPGERRYSNDWLGTWAVRALIPFGQLTIFLGTITTASGPHPGDHDKELVKRFDFKGTDTLEWIVQRHAAMAVIFALVVLAVIFIVRRQGGDLESAHRQGLAVLGQLVEVPALEVDAVLASAQRLVPGAYGRARVRAAYPPEPDGHTLFPFRRLFIIAQRAAG